MKPASVLLFLILALPNLALAQDRWWPPKVDWIVWGNVLTPPNVHERARDNTKGEVYLRPQITLKSWSEDTSLVTYAVLSLIKDANVFSYNNKAKLALGVEIKHQLTPAVNLSFGARWSVEQFLKTGKRNAAIQFTVDGGLWKTWRPDWLTRRMPDGTQLVLSGWANFRYPAALDPFEKDNGLLQGSVKFALDLPLRQTRVKVSPFVSVSAKWDIRKRSYNNTLEPAVGLDLKVPLGDRGQVTLGLKAAHEYRYESHTSKSGGIAYVSWYKRF